jgi:hypothetical protein
MTSSPKSSTGGFSSDLAKSMGGSGEAGSATVAAGSDTKAGDAKAGDAKAGDAKAGDAKAGDAKAGDAKAGDAKSGDAKAGDAKSGDAKAGDAKAGDAKAGDAKAGSAAKVADAKAGDAKASDAKAGSATPAGAGTSAPMPTPINLNAARVAVKPSAELAAIKLSLSPNWDRDVGEAGTISLVVKVPGGKPDETRVFSFRYGYEDAKAPAERDAYKKWLNDNKLLNATLDRQRGAAWYLEGLDGTGAPAFRIIVNYGGRKLICGGSLYKDVSSNQLGDIRDKTIIQAKEICESVAL